MASMVDDLTSAELAVLRRVIDARHLSEEEADELDAEVARGGGPLTDEIKAEFERMVRICRDAGPSSPQGAPRA